MKVLQFNQDATCCVVAASSHQISIFNCDPFGKCFEIDTKNSKKKTSNNNGSASNSESRNNEESILITNGSRDRTDAEEEEDNEDNALVTGNILKEGEFVIEMLFSTSLIAIADRGQGLNKGKKLKIVNTKRKSTICEIVFPHEIVDVVMNRKRMCVLLESDQIFIYDISCMKPLETIDLWEDHYKRSQANSFSNASNTGTLEGDSANLNRVATNLLANATQKSVNGSNPSVRTRRNSLRSKIRPRMVLSNDDRSILCFTAYSSPKKNKPNSEALYDVVIYDTLNVTPVNYLNSVHKGNVACLAVSHDGKLLATASDKGTIIRVFHTGVDSDYMSSRSLFKEFRRGTRLCNLYQLAFDKSMTMIGCVGDTDTIHLFKLDDASNSLPGDNSSNGHRNEEEDILASNSNPSMGTPKEIPLSKPRIANYFSKKIKSSIPNQNLSRNFAYITVNESNRSCLGFPDEFPNQVYIASDDGTFSIYSIPSKPGECVLTKNNKFT
ncbi:BAQ_1a_G0054360.mRNA.1.CDS.1 [Saccharomyces cerevisiae]|nr:BAQ_1a_G0054360.mRNA.1.CDS.1 [Saccharomyces cerevisiae]CAI4843677.1 BAM_G0054180.mRNA.1.CDS.1 [Saccharomyces cerevisiae]CAI7372726.1 BAM_G0054180.mRNA.1.CDS.1 [Saccharomyces cerevisiae]CAI7375758.1 BAQ_1a_G0054360.mRNA.1.CDS.1 [Saccharomyces cerevisiae]